MQEDEAVCPECGANIEDNGFCSNGHYIKICDEECVFFRFGECATDRDDGLCDKPEKYEM